MNPTVIGVAVLSLVAANGQTRAHFDRKIDVSRVDSRTLASLGTTDYKSRIEIQVELIEKNALKAPDDPGTEGLHRLEAFWSSFFLLRPAKVVGTANITDDYHRPTTIVQWQPTTNDVKVKSLYIVDNGESNLCVFEVDRDTLDSSQDMEALLTAVVDVSGVGVDIRNVSYSIYPSDRMRGIVGTGGAIFGENPSEVDIITGNRVGHDFGLTGLVTSSKRAYLVFTVGKKLFKGNKH